MEDIGRTSISAPVIGSLQEVTSILMINAAMVNDSGEYVCNVSSTVFETISSFSARMFVQSKSNYVFVYSVLSISLFVIPCMDTLNILLIVFKLVTLHVQVHS